MTFTLDALKRLIEACARGDPEARTTFQATYGPLMYAFPVRVFHLSEDEAGDFYLYAFENDRIFKRIHSFEGRNAIQFETYLSYYVLRDLLLEWVRTTETVDTISLDAPMEPAVSGDPSPITLHDRLATQDPTAEAMMMASDDLKAVEQRLEQVDDEKRIILKLLALGTVELQPADVRCIARLATRTIRETLVTLDEVMASLSAKAERIDTKWEALHTTSYWIHTYQRRMSALEAQIQDSKGQDNDKAKLEHEWGELNRKLAWRYRQQAKLRQELSRAEIRPSYKEIAMLLNAPLGTICSKVARARESFAQALAAARGNEA